MIYAITTGIGHVKIGYTAGGLQGAGSRLANVQSSCPLEVALVAVNPFADAADEKILHGMLREFCARGEWFWVSPIVASAVTALMLKVKKDPGALPEIDDSRFDEWLRIFDVKMHAEDPRPWTRYFLEGPVDKEIAASPAYRQMVERVCGVEVADAQ